MALKLNICDWSKEDIPSEKLQRYGTDALSDAELLSLLIGSGTNKYSAVEIGQNIMSKFNNNLNSLGKARIDELEDVEGIGTQTACKIMAAIELGRRREKAQREMTLDMGTATRIYNYMFPRMRDLEHEEFYVLLMNQNFHLIKPVLISKGGINETVVDVRIIMKEAVINNTTVLAACHNHPSGSLTPSRADDNLTMSIKNACSLMNIRFMDHVIVTDGAYYSFHEQGRL